MTLAELVGLAALPLIFFYFSNSSSIYIKKVLVFIGLACSAFFFIYAKSVLSASWSNLMSYFYQATIIIISLYILELFLELLLGALKGLAPKDRFGGV